LTPGLPTGRKTSLYLIEYQGKYLIPNEIIALKSRLLKKVRIQIISQIVNYLLCLWPF